MGRARDWVSNGGGVVVETCAASRGEGGSVRFVKRARFAK